MRHYLVIALTLVFAVTAQAAPFGDADDQSYAKSLWNALKRANLAGTDAIQTVPYQGQPPHGTILETLESTVTVHNRQAGPNGDTGVVIVKRNYGGDGVSKEAVSNDPARYLKAVTVMFKREGYDPDSKDWFWAKFKPNGELHVNPMNIKLAGRVAKGMNKGCISCHQGAQGGDYVFNHDRIK